MIYYIADMHFGHTNVLPFDNRPFPDTAQMDDTLIQNWNERVTSEDTVYVLGDAFWKNEENSIRIMERLQGHKHLIQGNHDRVKGKLRPYWESIEQYLSLIHIFFDFLKGPDINQGVKEYSTTDGAVLLDVRTPDEYRQGHIPGSKNVPLQSISKVAGMIDNKSTPIFVHCLSGARSRQAAAILKQMGYTNVKNIGGISAYAGKVERCLLYTS